MTTLQTEMIREWHIKVMKKELTEERKKQKIFLAINLLNDIFGTDIYIKNTDYTKLYISNELISEVTK